MNAEVKPLSDEQFKSYWKQAEEYRLPILKDVLLSDLYHRAEVASLGNGGTLEDQIDAEARRLDITLK
jgi:hypothetical protein